MMICPCGSKQNYTLCCGKYIELGYPAETALRLMTSRYTAYAMNNLDYIEKTMLGKPLETFKKSSPDMLSPMQWLGLEILTTYKGTAIDTFGSVEFKATYLSNDGIDVLHEKSEFIKIESTWHYSSGTILQ